MKTNKALLSTFVVILISGILIFGIAGDNKEKLLREGTPMYFPTAVDFAGEPAPLQISDVRERLDRELLINANLDATTVLIIRRANRAFPIIEPILQKYGVPDDFKYLAVIESGLVNATSPSGAKGVWQFMPDTAKEKGMEVNELVDERYHLEKSTEAACKYRCRCSPPGASPRRPMLRSACSSARKPCSSARGSSNPPTPRWWPRRLSKPQRTTRTRPSSPRSAVVSAH